MKKYRITIFYADCNPDTGNNLQTKCIGDHVYSEVMRLTDLLMKHVVTCFIISEEEI